MVVPTVDDYRLRSALRQVFNKFDRDHSGDVSTIEMLAMVKSLKMDMRIRLRIRSNFKQK